MVRRFAERIGDETALAQLYLLTRCDTAMTAPGNLSAWKDQLLGELYTRARDLLRGAERASGVGRARRARSRRRARACASSCRPTRPSWPRWSPRSTIARSAR